MKHLILLTILLAACSAKANTENKTQVIQTTQAPEVQPDAAYYPEEYFTEDFEIPASRDSEIEQPEEEIESPDAHSTHIKPLEELKQKNENIVATFTREVIKSSKPVVVKYTAVWCGPCQQMAPAFSQAADHFGDKIRFIEVDIDKCPEIQKKYSINSVPQMHFFNKGKKISTVGGALTQPQQIIDQVRMHLKVK